MCMCVCVCVCSNLKQLLLGSSAVRLFETGTEKPVEAKQGAIVVVVTINYNITSHTTSQAVPQTLVPC